MMSEKRFQCIGCAYENMDSPRDRDGMCQVCINKMAETRVRIMAKVAQHKANGIR